VAGHGKHTGRFLGRWLAHSGGGGGGGGGGSVAGRLSPRSIIVGYDSVSVRRPSVVWFHQRVLCRRRSLLGSGLLIKRACMWGAMTRAR
jgi:hypothetical protein